MKLSICCDAEVIVGPVAYTDEEGDILRNDLARCIDCDKLCETQES